MKILRNQKGLSLVEIMIAASAMIGVGLMMTKMNVNTNKSIKVSEKNMDMIGMLGEMRGILSNPTACDNSFLNKDASNGVITDVMNKDNVSAFTTGTVYGSSGLKINSMRLDNSLPNVDIASGTTNFIVVFDRGVGAAATQLIEKQIKLNITATGNNIDSCTSVAGGANGIWTRGADPTEIFYQDGNVGIGLDDPSEKLEVFDGDVFINNSGNALNADLWLQSDTAKWGISSAGSGNATDSGNLVLTEDGQPDVISITPQGKIVIRNNVENFIEINGGNGAVGTGPDILMKRRGLIASESNMYFSVDSDNNEVIPQAFIFQKDAETRFGTELMRITEDGKFGFGISNPVEEFEVAGHGHFIATSSQVKLTDVDNGHRWQLSSDQDKFLIYDGINLTAPVHIENGAPNSSFYIKANGNVGIGDNNPSAPLSIIDKIYFAQGGGAVPSGPDIQFDRRGLIAADSMLILNIDSDNSQTDAHLVVQKNANTNAGEELFRIQEDGLVRVEGKLQIRSNGGGNCDAGGDKGKLKYNDVTDQMQWCNGTAWQDMGGSSPPGTICGLCHSLNRPNVACQGFQPCITGTCPPGYTYETWGDIGAAAGQGLKGCIKN